MGLFKQDTMYDRRKRELEEEADRVRKNLQSLMKTVKKDMQNSEIAAPPIFNEVEASDSTKSSVLVEVSDEEITSMEDIESDEEVEDESELQGTTLSCASATTMPPYGTARLRHIQKQQETLPNYLATGSFGKRGPLTREKKIQRNKAVFMAVLALLAIFSLVSWLN